MDVKFIFPLVALLVGLTYVESWKFTTSSITTKSPLAQICPSECTCTTSVYTGLKLVCDYLDFKNLRNVPGVSHLTINGMKGGSIKLSRGCFANAGLHQLVTLSIHNTTLSEISYGVLDGLPHLEELDLSNNQIVYIHPNATLDSTNLRHLILRNNPGIQLNNPAAPHHPFLVSGSLIQLVLANCEIKDIPRRAFASLSGLDYLDLSDNLLTELKDDSLADLINLETLDLSNNSISKIGPDAFIDIDDLSILYLRGNPIKTLEGIEVSGLEELDASNCDIEVLYAGVFEGFADLFLLNLSMNSIKDIDEDAFVPLASLRYLDLSHNGIRSPLSKLMFQNCNDLQSVNLSNNRDFRVLSKFEGKFKQLTSLDVSNCGLSQIVDGTLDNFNYLTYLNLSGNSIGHIDANALTALHHLENLDLSRNRLVGLNSHIFVHNTMLTKLSLSGNMLKHVPAILFQPTADLDYLDLSGNRIGGLWNLSESFVMKNKNILGHLSTLNVAGNNIKKIHMHSFISLLQLAKLDISNNPIDCTADFSHMMQWLILNRVIPIHGSNVHPFDISVIDNNIKWDDFMNEVCPSYWPAEETTPKEEPQPKKESKPITKSETLESFVEIESTNNNMKPIITFRGEPIEIPSFDSDPGHVELVQPIEDRSEIIWSVFTIWFAIALMVFAIANATVIVCRRQRNKHANVDYKSLERGFIVRRGGRSVYQKLYEDCSIPTVHQDAKSASRLHTIFQLPQKV